jgi:hypothetical protein
MLETLKGVSYGTGNAIADCLRGVASILETCGGQEEHKVNVYNMRGFIIASITDYRHYL